MRNFVKFVFIKILLCKKNKLFNPVTTEYFTACLPLLEKYFGITAGYFNKELSDAKCLIPHREGNNVKYSIKEDCNLVLPFRHLECHDLLSLINSYGTITPINRGSPIAGGLLHP